MFRRKHHAEQLDESLLVSVAYFRHGNDECYDEYYGAPVDTKLKESTETLGKAGKSGSSFGVVGGFGKPAKGSPLRDRDGLSFVSGDDGGEQGNGGGGREKSSGQSPGPEQERESGELKLCESSNTPTIIIWGRNRIRWWEKYRTSLSLFWPKL